MSDPFTMRVVRHLIETPVELLSPVEQTARAGVFVALRPLVTTLTALMDDGSISRWRTALDDRTQAAIPTQPTRQLDTRGMGE